MKFFDQTPKSKLVIKTKESWGIPGLALICAVGRDNKGNYQEILVRLTANDTDLFAAECIAVAAGIRKELGPKFCLTCGQKLEEA